MAADTPHVTDDLDAPFSWRGRPIPMGTVAVLHRGELATDLVRWLKRMPNEIHFVPVEGNQIPRQRNLAVARMQGEWLLFVDSDCVPPDDAIPQLVTTEHALVGGVVLERFAPFKVCALKSYDPPAHWLMEDLPRDGVVPVPEIGTGCLLIRRAVFDAVGPPWFRAGQLVVDELREDADFSRRAAAAGFQPYLHCGVRVGHVTRATVYPGLDGQLWAQWPGPVDFHQPLTETQAGTVEELVRG